MKSVSMVAALLLLLAVAAGTVDGQGIQYRATIRDFIPSGCMRESEYETAWEVTDFSGLSNNIYDTQTTLGSITAGDPGFSLLSQYYSDSPGSAERRVTLTAANYCQYYPFLRNGTISGHPDFETQHTHYNAGPSRCFLGGIPQTCQNNLALIIKPTLETASSGLPKVVYCSDGPEDRCGATVGDSKHGTSRKKYFDSWYNDDAKYNKRTGYVLDLAESSPGSGSFVFSSLNEPTGNLHPHNSFRGLVDDVRYPNPFDAPVWPNNLMDWENVAFPSRGRKYGFTTEVHTYFEYRLGQQFYFSGDDDLWIFINGVLAVDLGGLHSPASQTIALNTYATQLGIVPGGIYRFDMYHAERHYSDSNFILTTTLSSSCNVVRSGTPAFRMTSAPAAAWRLGRGVDLVPTGPVLELVSPSTLPFSASSAYILQQQNVGAGFILSFNFAVDTAGQPEGFAVVLHDRPEGLKNLPKSTGANLGFRFLTNSVAFVFDMCSDRASNPGACREQRVSINYPRPPTAAPTVSPTASPTANGTAAGPSATPGPTPGPAPLAFNGPDELTVFDAVTRSLRVESETHNVRIEYLENPQWLEVYIDDSLYLRQEDFVIENFIGGRNAFLGFTTATGAAPSVLNISDVALDTVSIDTTQTVTVDLAPLAEPKRVLADGVSLAGFSVQTRDFCENVITYGGFANVVKGVFVELLEPTPDPVTESASRRLRALQAALPTRYADGSTTPQVFNATIVDNEDGTYTAALASTVPGTFALYVCVGEVCEVNVALDGDVNSTGARNATVTFANEDFSGSVARAVRVIPLTARPTTSPTVSAPTQAADTESAVLASSIGGGSALFALLLVGLILFVLRRRWQRDRAFIEDGALYNMEREVTYDKNDEYSTIGRMVMNTTAAIQRERAQKAGGATGVDALAAENEELQEQVRINKQKQQEAKQAAAARSVFNRGAKKAVKKKEFQVGAPSL